MTDFEQECREILERLTVLASIKTINVMNDPKANKEVKHYMKGAINGAMYTIFALHNKELTDCHQGIVELSQVLNSANKEVEKYRGAVAVVAMRTNLRERQELITAQVKIPDREVQDAGTNPPAPLNIRRMYERTGSQDY